MTAARPFDEISQLVPVPRLLIELPSWPRGFFENLRDLVFPRSLPPLELASAPAPFWSDVLVKRGLPWGRFLQSGVCHVIAFALLIGFTRFFALQPKVVVRPAFDHAQVVYYRPSEYLPPIDSRSPHKAVSAKADPEFSRQPIISVPREADNRSQTIVTAPNVKLKHDVALPNIVAWSNTEKPRLAIPPVPLTPAADISRIAPELENSVAAPPPDAAHLTNRRRSLVLQNSVVAPPPELRASNATTPVPALQPSVIAPPPSVETASTRPLGDLNIGPSTVIAPAPRLSVSQQRTIAGPPSGGLGAPQLVPPAPSVAASGSSGEFGQRGRVIALNLHPAVSAPAVPPAGNRRATFAATPEGHAGASGSPGSTAASTTPGTSGSGSKEDAGGSTRKGSSELPPGLYVGGTAAKTSAVAGNKSSLDSVTPTLMASVNPPRVTSAPSRILQPDSATKLSEPERAVFGTRKFYSVTLNMPNLNSSGGSWVIRFAQLDHDANQRDARNHEANSTVDDLSQPSATRKVDPAYPLQLMRENVAGTVILYAIIRADGTVGDVRVLRGVDDRLDRFASQAIAQWQFQPAMKNGVPVDVEATFQIPFRPARGFTKF